MTSTPRSQDPAVPRLLGAGTCEPGPFDLEHNLLPDTTMDLLKKLTARVAALEAELAEQRAATGVKEHTAA